MWPLKINGIDFERRVNRYGYNVSRERVEGPNSGSTKAGYYRVDLIRTRAILEMELNPLTQDEYAALLRQFEEPSVSVDYYDDKDTAMRRVEMIPEMSAGTKAFVKGRTWIKNLSLVLREV